jgi:spore coat polysaccharide biosynthesis predicted glycosyltransferase SpsG
MTRPRLLFRADASHEIGFGHVARVCALIEEAEQHGYETLAMFGGDEVAIRAWAADRRLTVELRDWSPTELLQAAEHPRAVAMIIDGPHLAPAVVPKLKKLRTIVLDDRGKCPLAVAAVVNHNAHAPSLAASYPHARARLLGRRYLMLRRDIRRYLRGACRPSNAHRLRVVVTFGGSDPVGATARTLRVLPCGRALDVVAVTGPGFRDDSALAAAIEVATERGHTVDVRRSPEDPGALFVSVDAAICSAGGTLGELAFLGCPALAYAIARDQVFGARYQVREGMIAGGGWWQDLSDEGLTAEIARFVDDDSARLELRGNALATADAEGARRIIEEALA